MTDSPTPEPGPVKATDCIAQALAKVQADLPAIQKDQTAKVAMKGGGEYSYTYADLATISAQVLPLLGRNGLAFTAWPTLAGNVFVLRYQLLHDSGQSITGEYPLGSAGSAQAVGSAITYARRYCLCAVVGVAPDDDDDGKSAASVAEPDPELEEARAKVRGAWSIQYGTVNTRELAQAYRAFTKGGDLWQATPGDLRKYAAYLSNLPKEDAGGDPVDHFMQGAAEGSPMSSGQRGLLFKLMNEIDLTEKGDQLAWINRTLGREYESRSQVTAADARLLIDGLQKGVDAPSEPA